jgi:hypothetical protein
MLSGDFGESFIAYLLSKEGIEVARASTVGFDLFAINAHGEIFPKDKIVGISVNSRIPIVNLRVSVKNKRRFIVHDVQL